jgi:thiosulfate/3-mercaptopyruvate sulfurtransferase
MATAAQTKALVSSQWVGDHLDDPKVRLVEVDVDTTAYEQGHIRNAAGWNWQTQLSDQIRRDIPSKEEWEKLLGQSGISNDTKIVFYGDNNNWFAAFAYWLFRLYGHNDVRLIDGGRKKWLDEGRETTTDAPQIQQTQYTAQDPDPSLRATRDQVASHQGTLVDVRSPGEYSGQLLAPENMPQEGAQRGGHIPGAANIPWASAVAENAAFKPVDQLRELYTGKGVNGDTEVVAYCRIGERSAHTWFALHEILGYNNVRNYDGSWTEWGSLIGAPIETGS